MADIIKVDIPTLNSYKTMLNSEYTHFRTVTKTAYKSSYLKSCNDLYVSKMSSKLDVLYNTIEIGYNTIIKWLESYIEDCIELEKQKIDSEANNPSKKINNLEEMEREKARKSREQAQTNSRNKFYQAFYEYCEELGISPTDYNMSIDEHDYDRTKKEIEFYHYRGTNFLEVCYYDGEKYVHKIVSGELYRRYNECKQYDSDDGSLLGVTIKPVIELDLPEDKKVNVSNNTKVDSHTKDELYKRLNESLNKSFSFNEAYGNALDDFFEENGIPKENQSNYTVYVDSSHNVIVKTDDGFKVTGLKGFDKLLIAYDNKENAYNEYMDMAVQYSNVK